MKTMVIYHSQTGFTRQYAEWIAEAANADCLPLSVAKKKDLTTYDAIVFGGWACAGKISGIRWFRGQIPHWPDKKLIAFCVGASPAGSPDIAAALDQNFTEWEQQRVTSFYCPGGFRYEAMPAPSKWMMKLFHTALKSKKDKTEAEQIMETMIASSYDLSDKKYIVPIVHSLNA